MKLIHSAARNKAVGPYSQAVATHNLFYSSGVIGLGEDGALVGGLVEQVHAIFENIVSVLSEEKLTLMHVIKTTVYLTSMNDYALFNEIYAKEFGGHRPARSTVQVARLPKDALVEIEFIAEREEVR
jgi:2-iminobutanoate/2-iminopropanoate deaminase